MFRSYTIRLKVTKRQGESLADLLEHLCVLYNCALAERTNVWEQDKKRIHYNNQQASLVSFRQRSPEVKAFSSVIQRDPLRRVDCAFEGFFRRVKVGEKPGYPRFKSKNQYQSFTVSEWFRIEGNTIIIPKLGGFRFKTKAKIKGTPKIIHVQRKGKHWLAGVVCDIGPTPEKTTVSSAVGIDLGLTTLATLSDGTEIANPRWTRQEEERLAEANRDFSRRKRGSKNRIKSKERLRRVHQRTAGLRLTYITSVAKQLLGKYDLVAHEKLNIRGMAKSNLAKSINDAAWGSLIWRLKCEAEKAGKWLIPVNPRNTTKTCSGCGVFVPKERDERQHDCPSCGLSLGRDHNAALNILRLGESLASKQDCALQSA